MSIYSDKYDWETREDARILQHMAELKADPKRLQRATECLQESIKTMSMALPKNPDAVNIPSRKYNPATVGKLDYPR